MGEILMSVRVNQNPCRCGLDTVVATGFDGPLQALEGAKAVADRLLPSARKLLYAGAWPTQGIYAKKDCGHGDMKGLKWRGTTGHFEDRRCMWQSLTIQAAELSRHWRRARSIRSCRPVHRR